MSQSQRVFRGLSGAFIVLDGCDGSGKTSVQQLVAEGLSRAGLTVTTCKDPGGTVIGNRIRSVLLDHDLATMSLNCESLLFMASRAQLVMEVIWPALAEGRVVLCDRYVSSTCAYQGAIGANPGQIIDLADFATAGTWPDLTMVLDVPVEVSFERIRLRAGESAPRLDAMERRSRGFHEQVRRNFLGLEAVYPAPVNVIDGTQPLEAVAEAVLDRLSRLSGPHREASRGQPRVLVNAR